MHGVHWAVTGNRDASNTHNIPLTHSFVLPSLVDTYAVCGVVVSSPSSPRVLSRTAVIVDLNSVPVKDASLNLTRFSEKIFIIIIVITIVVVSLLVVAVREDCWHLRI